MERARAARETQRGRERMKRERERERTKPSQLGLPSSEIQGPSANARPADD